MVHFMLVFPHRAGSFTGDTAYLEAQMGKMSQTQGGLHVIQRFTTNQTGLRSLAAQLWLEMGPFPIFWETLAAINLPNVGMIYEVYIVSLRYVTHGMSW